MHFSDPAQTSTLLMTGLMVIGLAFFIRASTKDRIEVQQFGSQQSAELLQQNLTTYFRSRAYQLTDEPTGDTPETPTEPSTTVETTTLVGLVSPSWFMAIFLSALAAVGLACFALIMATLFPGWGIWCLGLVFVAPLAGWFYWRKSSRPETVKFKVEADTTTGYRSKLTIQGHRDEIAELQAAFSTHSARLQDWSDR